MTVPTNTDPLPSVAEEPTCQNTLQGLARLISLTRVAEAVISCVGIWKMNAVLGSPSPSSTISPEENRSCEVAL